ncbi:MAG: hypothetical protein ACM359_19905 [Bacillota bacterium]
MPLTPLPSRLLPWPQRPIPPFLWQLPDSAAAINPRVLETLSLAAATWFFIPRNVPQSGLSDFARALEPLADAARIVIAIDAAQLQPRRSRIIQDRLAPLSRSCCEAIYLQDISPSDVKAGSPFHRLSQLRDQGITSLFFIDAPDHATAEWMLDHSPAHAVCIPFGLADQTAKYRLFEDAAGFGTGLIARPPHRLIWQPDSPIDLFSDITFILADPAIAALLLPLPSILAELQLLLDAATHPMPDSDRQQWWNCFSQQVPPPAPLPRSTPPE